MFLEKTYRGNNKWYFYILTLIIVFAAVQLTSIPLVIYSIIMNPNILNGDMNNILGRHEHQYRAGPYAVHVCRGSHRTYVVRKILSS